MGSREAGTPCTGRLAAGSAGTARRRSSRRSRLRLSLRREAPDTNAGGVAPPDLPGALHAARLAARHEIGERRKREQEPATTPHARHGYRVVAHLSLLSIGITI